MASSRLDKSAHPQVKRSDVSNLEEETRLCAQWAKERSISVCTSILLTAPTPLPTSPEILRF
eukprot:3754605-Amphidinium_carterae.2